MKNLALIFISVLCLTAVNAGSREFSIDKQYLNLPVSQSADRKQASLNVEGKGERTFVIRLSSEPQYWVFCDVSSYKGKRVRIDFEGDGAALEKIYQADAIAGQDSMYAEKYRPQFHFTTKRGWINDPNGLLYHDGEYHLFYQHNPYEKEWENMHWGHAVSKDMVRWRELPTALFPDSLGTMFSGSAVVDHQNTAGFNRTGIPAQVALYTAASPQKQVQCVAYSLDKGRTFTKYDGNPVIDSKQKWNSPDTRDPKVFWYAPLNHWVMALHERDGHSIYTSSDLKNWQYQSHVTGFWECPELFELPVDGNPRNTLWVMYGASGTYMLGEFDGKTFTPHAGKYYYTTGSIYAAQTFTGMPDGRRVQIGWGRIAHRDMPFNGMMLMPTELTLRTTKDGVRLFSEPIAELSQLFKPVGKWESLSQSKADEAMREFGESDRLRVKTTIKLSHATDAGLSLDGQRIIEYDLNSNKLNGVFYSPQDMTSMELSADIYIDRTSIEVFVDGGAYSYSMERTIPRSDKKEGLRFWGNNIEVKNLEVYRAESIW